MENSKLKKVLANKVFVVIAIIIVGIAGSMSVNTVLVQGSGTRTSDYAPSLGGSSVEMIITGDIQGPIEGEGRNGVIIVEAMVHEINATYDEVTGQPSGCRQHSPIRITKMMDKASPHIYQALCTDEQMQVTLNFNRPNLTDSMAGWEQYYAITLTNARIVGIKFFDKATPQLAKALVSSGGGGTVMDRLTEDVTLNEILPVEEVTLTYEEIEWEYTVDGTFYIDDYYNPCIP